MSKTHHHGKWGRESREQRARKSHPRIFWAGSRRVGEAPSWHIRLEDIRPARRADTILAHNIVRGADPEGLMWGQSPNRKPHTYYW